MYVKSSQLSDWAKMLKIVSPVSRNIFTLCIDTKTEKALT